MKFYIYSKFKQITEDFFNSNNQPLVIITDINIEKTIPRFISSLYDHKENKNFNAISATLQHIYGNVGRGNKLEWELLKEYTQILDYPPIKMLLEGIIPIGLSGKYSSSLHAEIKAIIDLIEHMLEAKINNDIDNCEFQKQLKDYLDTDLFINMFTNYSDFIMIPGITAIEKEFSGNAKKHFPINIKTHMEYETGFSLFDLETKGPFSMVGETGRNKQLNHLDNKFVRKLEFIAAHVRDKEQTRFDNEPIIEPEYKISEKKYLAYILYAQNEFLNFVKHYRLNKNFNYEAKSLTALLLIDYIKCHSIIHGNNGLNLTNKKMEGINTNYKEIIEHNLKYINTIFDFCNIFFVMFMNMNPILKKTNIVFYTADNTSLPFEIYDFKFKKAHVTVIPKISSSIFNNYSPIFFEQTFTKPSLKDIFSVYNNSKNLNNFFSDYIIGNNIEYSEKLINNLITDNYILKWRKELSILKESNPKILPKPGNRIYEICLEIITHLWNYVEYYLIQKNIKLLEELKIIN